MRRKALRESDLRSLERRSMYSIFAPLDADERLPRELIMDARRQRQLGRRELAGVLWLPALFLILVLAGWLKLSAQAALVMVGLLFIAFVVFAASDRR
jgi:Flp pilus assembly protein TadB